MNKRNSPVGHGPRDASMSLGPHWCAFVGLSHRLCWSSWGPAYVAIVVDASTGDPPHEQLLIGLGVGAMSSWGFGIVVLRSQHS
jgi:hypothetical protein